MVFSWLKQRFKHTAQQEAEFPALAPEQKFYAIGDIHGRMDLLEELLSQLDTGCPIVFLGDNIDRGENSAQVLRHLHALSSHPEHSIVCLMGNHEEMLLQFLELPEYTNHQWLRNGGLQTLSSFGVASAGETLDDEAARTAATQLRDAMGEPLISWLQTRPLMWTSGNVTAVHAALDPTRPVEHQHRQACLWGHRQFSRIPRSDGQWVIHGHTIVPRPSASNGIISIDTGAFATGRLTAAQVSSGSVRFVSTGG